MLSRRTGCLIEVSAMLEIFCNSVLSNTVAPSYTWLLRP